jgi:hypothetical protein
MEVVPVLVKWDEIKGSRIQMQPDNSHLAQQRRRHLIAKAVKKNNPMRHHNN